MTDKLKEYIQKVIIRQKYLKDLENFCFAPFIKIIVGARRVGKSFYLFSIIKKLLELNKLKENQIFYINKEWLEYDDIQDYKDLNNYFLKWKKENKVGNNFFLGIDEVQEIKDWQKFILSIWSSYPQSIIFITGSNSKLLSKDIGTNLRGRYISKKIFPLSLNEFSLFSNKNIDNELLFEYINYGGLPAINFIDDLNIKLEYLKGVYNTIFVKDLLEYENIRNTNLLKNIHKFLFKEFGNLINSKNISNFLKKENIKTSIETILNYMEFSFNSFLFDEVSRYDIRGKKLFEITKKIYSFDLGIRNSIVGINLQNDIGGIYENLVYNHFISNGFNVFVGILGEKEIDFIAEKSGKKIYIQVAYLLSDEKVIDREFGNLMKIKDGWEKIVISSDNLFVNNYEGIKHYNILDWLQNME
ncbi:ATP-binding protein [Candidatus Vampirococcus lugosii]|uniref:ATPase n=1 Tax=Candidatus Vampirococcus lugosii TaxID=2789015 RepID=A0ABS5QM71_9BACT|nr:ATP-binding protein [Candidatus Vampirococcus lugosii]MBS8122305.1 ATPase [Candidatus Vampirococcus lugosii]